MSVLKNLCTNPQKSRKILHNQYRTLGLISKNCCSKRTVSTINLGGIFPPIPTSFKSDESVCYSDLKQNFEKWNSKPFAGYVIQGSNGEYPYLTTTERLEVVKQVKKIIAPDKLLIAGSGCESTLATIEMSNAMAENGADAVLVVTPSFYKNQMISEALLKHYTEVADHSKVPVILYNVPANTGVNIPVDVLSKLSCHPNIVGTKDSSGDISRIGHTVHKTSDDFQVLAGSASFLLAAYTVGAVGGICGLANVLGEEVCRLHQLYKENKMEEAKQLQHCLIEPNAAVTSRFGVPGVKVAMDLFGFKGGRPRSPLQPLTHENRELVKKAFQENGFL